MQNCQSWLSTFSYYNFVHITNEELDMNNPVESTEALDYMNKYINVCLKYISSYQCFLIADMCKSHRLTCVISENA